ncbi:hypothetical protein [Saccharothrix sp. HUAS TT1]|uniref:hypothetical protein n=1 Tax=unclassified Saccharothrix TaxID=2593673 RepID=UPI00345C0E6F
MDTRGRHVPDGTGGISDRGVARVGGALLTALHLTQPRTVLGDVGYVANFVGLGLSGAAAYALNVVLFHLGNPPPACRTCR